jgi:phosphatidylserine/phosphatidylglycerophosphate/cardiolipin synthase-like enzyme
VLYSLDGATEPVTDLPCTGKPFVAQDEDGRMHVVWSSDTVLDVLGQATSQDVIYESIRRGDRWSDPAIVARFDEPGPYGTVSDRGGLLHMAWVSRAGRGPVHYALQNQYDCDPTSLTGVERIMYGVATEGGYRPSDDIIPFCGNRYDMMLFTPNVDPAFSDREPTTNGAYDDYVELAKKAEYEVLFATMAYKDAVNHDSSGAVFADGVYQLYQQVKANPEKYPRGMLVRIMLGNSPPIDTLEPNSQLWLVLKDLQEAGIEKMIDPEVGWRLEVANYGGAWPHSHVKTLVIDGKMVVASGFNHEYKPLPKNHYSGKGLGDADTGILFTGPIAQHSHRIYDEIWEGSVQRHCDDLTIDRSLWRVTCEDSRGVPTHVPEVMRFYQTGEDSVAFSMFRNSVYGESDEGLVATISSATESVDIAQAMFSMPMICNLNHFFDVCSYSQALPYMEALVDAAENGAHVRLLIQPYPSQSIENVIAMEIINKEALARGLDDRIEVRWFDDFLHAKNALIDDEFLIVGSQNMHYSAFGVPGGLAEYNLGTSDPDAIDQFKRMFEYYWSRGIPTTAPGS